MIWIITALITGLILIYLLTPLMHGGQARTATVLMLLIGGGALGLYLWQGNPGLPDQPAAPRLAERQQMLKQVAIEAEKLLARLDAEPNDVSGWLLLAESYNALGRKDEQKAALAKVIALLPDAAPIKARLQAQLEELSK